MRLVVLKVAEKLGGTLVTETGAKIVIFGRGRLYGVRGAAPSLQTRSRGGQKASTAQDGRFGAMV